MSRDHAAYELYARSETDDKPSDAELTALGTKPTTDPCARVIATLAFDATSKDVPRARAARGGGEHGRSVWRRAPARGSADPGCPVSLGAPDDRAADVQKWRPIAAAGHKAELAARLDRQAAIARFWLGDVAAAHAELVRLMLALPHTEPVGATREIHGEVVDARGRGVAGASVAVATQLLSDTAGIGSPVFETRGWQIASTDDAGRFEIAGAVQAGAIVAQLGDRRSTPAATADHVRLVLAPTRSVSGKVDLQGTPHTACSCIASTRPTGPAGPAPSRRSQRMARSSSPCAIAFTGDLLDPQAQQRIQDHLSQLALKCEPVGADSAVVVLSVPPQQRLD